MSANDDQRIRELLNRLVAMSPEPPPFPEEVIVTQREPQRRGRPLLLFAGAAALVLAFALIPVLLSGGGPEPVGTTLPVVDQTTVVTTVIPQTTVPTDTTVPDTTVPQELLSYPTEVYFVQSPENSFTGNPALAPFYTTVEGPEGSAVELLTLRLLTAGELTLPPGFGNGVPDGVEFIAADVDSDGILVIDVNEAFRAGAGGLLADMTMLNQLVYTVTQNPGVTGALFRIGGQTIQDFGTDGLDISDPLTRETFRDSLNSVIITEPVIFGGDGLPQVAGIANVFEATVSLEIVDQTSGDVVYEDFDTATCGTGCWGEFEFFLDTPALTPDALIRVFWHSPEDGRPSDIVTIPVVDGSFWDFLGDQG
jgi:hypothetical protein